MKYTTNYFIVLALMLSACSKPSATEETSSSARVSVDVVSLESGNVKDELTMFANTLYLKRNVVTSPIPAFITNVYIKLGDAVKEGQVLYQLETKERRALGSQAVVPDSTATSFGMIIVKAPSSGIVTTLDKQQIGDYVLEGGPLCTIAESSALAFAVNVPFEFISYARTGMKCTLTLPDNSVHAATFTTLLTTMNTLAQTQTVLAKSDDPVFLPENLIVQVRVNKSNEKPQQLLPKKCILSDEMQQEFWVMKLLNDTMAVRVNVKLGYTDKNSAEIISPALGSGSRFLLTGNYGLPDTAFVSINR